MNLTTRLTLRTLAVVAAVLVGVTLLAYELVLTSGRDEVDRRVRAEADAVAGELGSELVERGADGALGAAELERAARNALALHPSSSAHVARAQVGEVGIQSSGGPPRTAALAREGMLATEPGVLRTVGTSAGDHRVLDLEVVGSDGGVLATVTVLAPLDAANEAASTVLVRTAGAAVFGLLIGGAALALVLRRTLRPLHDVASTAAAIEPGDLGQRVPQPEHDDEVGRLAREINEMLGRIEHADRRQRDLLAAVSHELRTPLTIAEGNLELLAQQDLPERASASVAVVRQELVRAHRLLEDILAVARGGEAIEVRDDPVFLPDLFDRVRSWATGLQVDQEVVVLDAPPLVAMGDEDRLLQCIVNLVGNAIDHTPADTSVVVSAEDDGQPVLRVRDDGPGIAPEVVDRAFEPFVSSRPAVAGRPSGLGLAIVRSLADAQGAEVVLDTSSAGTEVRIRLRGA